MWKFRQSVAIWLVEVVRGIVPEGHSWKYALRKPVLDVVNAMNLKNPPDPNLWNPNPDEK